jgi:hypothetical protein
VFNEIASTGHVFMHMPQPVQAIASMCIFIRPPSAGLATMASYSHSSMQLTQFVPRFARHASEIPACSRQGSWPGSWLRFRAPGSQVVTHSPQNVHPPLEKSSSGSFLNDMLMIFSLQAVTHLPQPSQALEKAGSANAQGGRRSGFWPRQSPRRNCALDIEFIKIGGRESEPFVPKIKDSHLAVGNI